MCLEVGGCELLEVVSPRFHDHHRILCYMHKHTHTPGRATASTNPLLTDVQGIFSNLRKERGRGREKGHFAMVHGVCIFILA